MTRQARERLGGPSAANPYKHTKVSCQRATDWRTNLRASENNRWFLQELRVTEQLLKRDLHLIQQAVVGSVSDLQLHLLKNISRLSQIDQKLAHQNGKSQPTI